MKNPTKTQEERWRSQIKEALFVSEAPLPLAAQTHSRFHPAPDVVAERVSYETQFGMRIPAIIYLPKSRPKRQIPALIIVNGHGGDKYSWYAFYAGILYAKAGVAVLTYDPTGEGERNSERKSGTREHDKIEPPAELAQRLGGLMITDVMQAISYLTQRPEVDARRIAAVGYSMGSFVLSLTGAIELRLHACVLVGGGNLDGTGEYWDNSKPMCQGTPYQSLQFLGDRPAVIYALHASRGPTLIFNGLLDTTVNIPAHGEPFFQNLHDRTVELRGNSEGVFDFGFVKDAAHRPFFVTRPVVLWLHRHLDFPYFTETAIKTMPETHISEWTKTHGIEMDALYSSEEREGGTFALGADIPGFSRNVLDVFTAQEWESLKDNLVHESWREKVRICVNNTA